MKIVLELWRLEKTRQLLAILAIISLSNTHLALMQGVTWIEMAVDSASKTAEFLPALAQSISPETKCERCCDLDKSRQDQQDRSVKWKSKLIGSIIQSENFHPPQLCEISRLRDFSELAAYRPHAPEIPPPDLCS